VKKDPDETAVTEKKAKQKRVSLRKRLRENDVFLRRGGPLLPSMGSPGTGVQRGGVGENPLPKEKGGKKTRRPGLKVSVLNEEKNGRASQRCVDLKRAVKAGRSFSGGTTRRNIKREKGEVGKEGSQRQPSTGGEKRDSKGRKKEKRQKKTEIKKGT